MAGLTLGYRQSAAESFDDNRSRYAPSSVYSARGPESVYSGPGPEVEALPQAQPAQSHIMQPIYPPTYVQNGGRSGAGAVNGIQLPLSSRARNSDTLNLSDPVTMHLLTETALGDSKNFELLSFEELDQLKKNRTLLRNRVQQTKKKLALETKLRDAAQSLNRLYSNGHQRGASGSSQGSQHNSSVRVDDEYTASNRRVEELTRDLEHMKEKLDSTERRILEHTAGVLQATHRGLKKNLRKHELPRSPESMASGRHRSISGGLALDVFDERSLYPVPDYVNDFIGSTPVTPMVGNMANPQLGTQAMDGLSKKLDELNAQLQRMILRADVAEEMPEPPTPTTNTTGPSAQLEKRLEAQLSWLSQSLDMLSETQQRTIQESENVNTRINDILQRTDSVGRAASVAPDQPRGEDLASQLAFSTRILEQLQSRIDGLVEQKEILTRQIQQQRELNSKSDAERDAHIHNLSAELAESQQRQALSEREGEQFQHQISQLMDQLDLAREENQSIERQRGVTDNKAIETEKEIRKRVEAELTKARDQADSAAQDHQTEMDKLLAQIAGIQTELVMAQAELDGAYGTRAQRAADVSSNPAVQKQIDDLRRRNGQLQKELQDTLGDYEQMTKESIEFEKERDNLEASIDSLRDKCEALESQLNEEKLRVIGSKSAGPNDTTSTMVLKNEFKKMMRDTRAENLKVLKHEQEERRRLESVIRQMKKDMGSATSVKSANLSPNPS